MILPVFAYGQPVLKRVAQPISADFPDLEKLIFDMWETMYHAEGVGVAAPQIGQGIRLFLIDTAQIEDEDGKKIEGGIRQVFINAQAIDISGKTVTQDEGCLSIPDIRGDVDRPDTITLKWLDENFVEQEQKFEGLNARVIQHEYDHIEGVLFTERLKPIRKQLVRRKMEKIRSGKVATDYKMRFFNVR